MLNQEENDEATADQHQLKLDEGFAKILQEQFLKGEEKMTKVYQHKNAHIYSICVKNVAFRRFSTCCLLHRGLASRGYICCHSVHF